MKNKYIILVLYVLVIVTIYNNCNNTTYGYEVVNEDIIGSIRIDNLGIDNKLLQGLDDEYYMEHDIDKNNSGNSVIFIGWESDLLRHKTNTLYIPYEKVLDNIDIININYLDKEVCYYVTKEDNYDKLIIKLYLDNKVIKTMKALRCK